MYKEISFLMLTLLAMQAGAQNARFIEVDKTWHVLHEYGNYHITYDRYYTFTAESDTVINGIHYMRLFDVTDNWKRVYAIFREEDGRVYRYDAGRQAEQLYYDFTLSPADVFTFQTGRDWLFDYQCTVTAAGQLALTDGRRARKVTFTAIPLGWDYEEEPMATENVWIEGIGNVCHPACNINDGNADGGSSHIVTVKRGDELIYSHGLTGIAGIRESTSGGRCYDLQGRPVDPARQHGFIITAGRKVWKK